MAGFCRKGLELFKEMAFCPPKTLPPYNVILAPCSSVQTNGMGDRLTLCQRLLCFLLDHCKSMQPGLGGLSATYIPQVTL